MKNEKILEEISWGDFGMKPQLPQVFVFKYKIGSAFLTSEKSIIKITGYNYFSNEYRGEVFFKEKNNTVRLVDNNIHEDVLNNSTHYESLENLQRDVNKKDYVKYRVYYFDNLPPDGKPMIGQRALFIDLELTGIRELCKVLNGLRKKNSRRKFVSVTIMDDNDKFINFVRLLPQEVLKQEFITGKKERLLAHAKYVDKQDISISF